MAESTRTGETRTNEARTDEARFARGGVDEDRAPDDVTDLPKESWRGVVRRAMRACTWAVATRGWLPLWRGSRPAIPPCSKRRFQREMVGGVVRMLRMIST